MKMPRGLKIIAAFLVLMSIMAWYDTLFMDADFEYSDILYFAAYPLIAIGLYLRSQIAKIALYIICAISIVLSAFVLVPMLAMIDFKNEGPNELAIHSLLILSVLAFILIYSYIIYYLRSDKVNNYFLNKNAT